MEVIPFGYLTGKFTILMDLSNLTNGYWLILMANSQFTISYGFPMVFLWVFLWFSYGFPMIFLWFSYGFPMVFLWFSYGFPMVFLWFSYGFGP